MGQFFKVSFLALLVTYCFSGCNPLVREPTSQPNFNPGIPNAPQAAPDHLIKVSGDLQWGIVSTTLSLPPTVQVVDQTGAPYTQGVLLEFQVGATGGSVTHSIVTTDQNGLAFTPWTLGASVGVYTLIVRPVEITFPGLPGALVFSASALSVVPSTTLSTITGTSVVADGVTSSTVTITLLDNGGNPISRGCLTNQS